MPLVKTPTEASRHVGAPPAHGTVVSLQLCVKHQSPMQKVKSVMAIENFGLDGDRHAIPESARQVLLIEQETLVEYDVPIGAIRENITTRGIDLMRLPKGTILEIGDSRLETTKECEPCSMVDDVRMGLRQELQGKRGMLARVVKGGDIKIGDRIRVLKRE